jgi:hypothetical protein
MALPYYLFSKTAFPSRRLLLYHMEAHPEIVLLRLCVFETIGSDFVANQSYSTTATNVPGRLRVSAVFPEY